MVIESFDVGQTGPVQPVPEHRGFIEQAVQVSAHDLVVLANRTVIESILPVFDVVQSEQRISGVALGQSGVDFVSAYLQAFTDQFAGHVAQGLVAVQRGFLRQQAEPRAGTRGRLDRVRVVNPLAEHLVAATNADQFTAVTQVPLDLSIPALFAQPGEITAHVFAARQHDQIGRVELRSVAHELAIDLRMHAQHVEIGVIACARIHRYHDLQNLLVEIALQRLALRDAVFGLDMQVVHVGNHREGWHRGFFLEPFQSGFEQRHIAAKAVDYEPDHALLLGFAEQRPGSVEMRKHTAAIDIGNDDDRAIGGLGKPHVGNIVFAQVDLGRAAGTLDQHEFVVFYETGMRVEHRRHQFGLVRVVGHRVHVVDGAAVDDHLRTLVAGRLEQDRVHRHRWFQPAGLRLHRLRATNLATLGGDRGIERHILRLERHHAPTVTRKNAADCGHQNTFAGVRRGALHHQRLRVGKGHYADSCCASISSSNACSRSP